MGKYDNIDFKPTEAMAKAAKRGLAMREKQPPSNRGGTAVGLTRAKQLVNRQNLSPDTVKRMYSFFSRHEVDKQSESWKRGNSKGEQAWLLWGGDPGFAWSKRKVEQIKKADEKKEGDDMENKSFDLEILEVKQEGNKGIFKAYLNTYNNVDYGNDMTMKSFGDMNVGRKVSLLKQHKQGTEHGMLTLGSDNKGVTIDGELYLEHDEKGNQIFPEAHRTYSMLKRGVNGGVPVKFSMGYNVIKKELEMMQVNGRNVQVRKLIKGYIGEGSVVTFPMNPGSVQTNQVKEISNEEVKNMEMESKAMNMEQMMQLEESIQKMDNMRYSFFRSCNQIMRDENMSMTEKQNMINGNCAYMMANYPKACGDVMKAYHDENGMQKKGSVEEAETKANLTEPEINDNINTKEFFEGLEEIKSLYEGDNNEGGEEK